MQHKHKHPVPRTTHTVEMTQIAELNDHLAARDPTETISAADLGLTGVPVLSGRDAEHNGLPAQALLERVCYDGPPEFPYIHAHFRPSPTDPGSVTVDLHTRALRELSRRLHLHEIWGVGSADDAGGAPGR
jgi:hypothetical protein